MNQSNDLFDPRIASWLEDDPVHAPGQVLETVLAAIPAVPQHRGALRVPWRFSMLTSVRLLGGLAAAAVIAVAGLMLANGRPGPVGSTTPLPSPSPAATPRPAASFSSSALVGTSWTTVITAADTPAGVDRVAVGTWTLRFPTEADGPKLFLDNPNGGGPGFLVTYTAGNDFVLPADTECPTVSHNPVGPSTSTYHYVLTATSLVITLVTPDNCTPRVVNLTAHAWVPAKP